MRSSSPAFGGTVCRCQLSKRTTQPATAGQAITRRSCLATVLVSLKFEMGSLKKKGQSDVVSQIDHRLLANNTLSDSHL